MKCICCNKSVKPYPLANGLSHEDSVFKTEEKRSGNIINQIQAENRMWLGGVVGNISAGFGSSLDGDQFVISICDDCLSDKIEDGTIALTGNWPEAKAGYSHNDKKRLEKYRIIWRRNNNLDTLL